MKTLPMQSQPNNLSLKKKEKKEKKRLIHLRTHDKTNPKKSS